MRVFSTLMSWSNENKSCVTVDKREFCEICFSLWYSLSLELFMSSQTRIES